MHGLEKPYYATPGDGIFHFYFPEQGLVLPGQFIPGADSHSRAYGAYGAVGFGVGLDDARVRLVDRVHLLHGRAAAPRRLPGQAPALGLGQGHRARAPAALGREAVAGDVGRVRGRRAAAPDRVPQHDRQHDGGGRGAERDLRAGRDHRGLVPREGDRSSSPIPASRPERTRVYEIDETLALLDVAAHDREALLPRQRVSRRGGRARAAHLRQGDDRLVHQRQLRRPALGGARPPRGARVRDSGRSSKPFAIFPGSGGVGAPDREGRSRGSSGESIAEVFRSVGGEIRQSWCGPCFGQGPDALDAGPARDHVLQPELAEPHGRGRRGLPREPRRRGGLGPRRLHGPAVRARPGLGPRERSGSRP